jgi:hypothetical protein
LLLLRGQSLLSGGLLSDGLLGSGLLSREVLLHLELLQVLRKPTQKRTKVRQPSGI